MFLPACKTKQSHPTMIKRHLHRQIYATIIGCLLLLVIITSGTFALVDDDRFDRKILQVTAQLTFRALPPATASRAEQARAITELGQEIGMALTLFDANKELIGAYGKPSRRPPPDAAANKWRRHGLGPSWRIRLPDNRWITVRMEGLGRPRPILGLLILLIGVTLAIGLGSYPFVKKLTGRLERLQKGVDRFGTGDLSTRVDVEGFDEIATLASSFNSAATTIERLVNSNRQLLANASHELRTPLARVRLGVEMLKEGGSPARRAALERDIAELDSLIDEILLMSRLDTGHRPALNETVDLLGLVAEEVAHYDAAILDGTPVELLGSTKLLRRLVRNLLDNATKHGRPPVDVKLQQSGDFAVLRVHDNGDGIANGQRENIFEPFTRGQGKQNVPGYGLGLSLVRQIAEAHGGSAKFIQTDSPGCTVEIRLAAKLPEEPKPAL